MSVPLHKRSLSNTQFLYEIYTFNIRLGEICMNTPQKYRLNYSDHIIQTGLKALQYAQIANDIYLTKYTTSEEFQRRESLLLEARGLVDNISTTAYIFLEQVRKSGAVKYEKILKQEEYIGEKTNIINGLITNVMKSDKKRYKEFNK